MPFTVDTCKIIVEVGGGGGGGICWRRRGTMTNMSLEAWWLAERSVVARCIVSVVLASFGGWGATRLYDFACPPKQRGMRTMFVAEAEAKRGVGKKIGEVKLR